jgi:ribosomal-protein-alanine N-acetyltransferase
MKRLETNRLILRSFTYRDVAAVYDYAKRDDVGPKAGWRPHKNKKETKQIIKKFIEKDDVYAMVLKATNKTIGSIGVHHTSLGSLGQVYELGYVLHPAYHRQGIMSEAVDKVLENFFFGLNHDKIYVGHFIENTPSQKLIEKLGFEWVEDILYTSRDYGEKQSKIYALTKLQYTLNKTGGNK